MNKLYFGDNIGFLKDTDKFPSESVDLIYLDPPFNSKQQFSLLFKHHGHSSDAQTLAFNDTWHWAEAGTIYQKLIQDRDPVAPVLSQLYNLFGKGCDMMAYLTMMAPRLYELHRVLKPTGSIYLHCDPTASHYLKVLMDSIFGPEQFENEIIWQRTNTKSDYRQGATNWPRVHDVILHYYKDAQQQQLFHQPFVPYSQEYVDSFYRYKEADGRPYRLSDLTAPGAGTRGHPRYEFMGVTRFWRYNKDKMEQLRATGRIIQTKPGSVPCYKRYLDEGHGVPVSDVWSDISAIQGASSEYLGYPTQKPIALLERIITASSDPDALVLDPFCGCGAAVIAAQKTGRKWIGIDITHLAINVIRRRLHKTFGPSIDFTVAGEPVDLDGARALAEKEKEGRYQFQWWVLDRIDGRRKADKKQKGADWGIDGRIFFTDEPAAMALKTIIVSVKSGGVSIKDIKDLIATVEQEHAEMGALATLEEATEPMRIAATGAGYYHSVAWNKDYPKIQILTIAEILAGKKVDYPGQNMTYPAAIRLVETPEQKTLTPEDDDL